MLCISPVVMAQAQAALVKSYKRLRSDDATPGSASAYRITVRQLEALVRLSEAMARVYCSQHVTVQHVAEVRRAHLGMHPVQTCKQYSLTHGRFLVACFIMLECVAPTGICLSACCKLLQSSLRPTETSGT